MVALQPGEGPRPPMWRLAMRRLAQRVVYRAPGERDECPACASREIGDLDVLPLRAAKTGFVCVCDGCGLVFSNPLPTPDDLAHCYGPAGAWAADRREAPDESRPASGHVGGTWTQMFDPIRQEMNV